MGTPRAEFLDGKLVIREDGPKIPSSGTWEAQAVQIHLK